MLAFEGLADSPLRMPTAVAVSQNGTVFVADGVNDRIVIFDSGAQVVGEIREGGGIPLRQPVGVAVDASGRVWIADTGNQRVITFGGDMVFARQFDVPQQGAARKPDVTGIAVAASGNQFWVADNDNHRLLRYDDAGGNWQAYGGRGESRGQFQYPFFLSSSSTGDVFVTDVLNSRVQVINDRGDAVRTIGTYGVEPGDLFRPGGIALDRDNNLWVADSIIGVVQVFRPDGSMIDVLRDASGAPLHLASPMGLAFDAQNCLYVVELRANRVQKLKIEKPAREVPPIPRRPSRTGVGQQARACTICHLDWIQPFSEGRESALMQRPVSTADEPVAARSEMCLSCHDGSIADSRERVWQEHGHRTGIIPPPTIKVPSNLPLVDMKIACRTCHSAHGSESGDADPAKIVMLRVKNVASELCTSCHTDKTRGPMFGTHPTGGMPWPVPQALIDAGAKVGPNPRELTCQVCHTPHGAAYDHLLVMGTTSNQLCVTCHDQIRPGMFRAGGAAEHPLSPKVTEEQAAAIQRLGTKLSPEGNLICLSCHKLHHGHGQRFMLADELSDGQMCLQCHQQRQALLGTPHDLRLTHPQERNRLGMTVADGGPCSACHLFHRFAREATPSPGDETGQCTTCHQAGRCAEAKVLGSTNHPSSRCTDCHNPHEARVSHFLAAEPEALCAKCHADKTLLAGGAHDAARLPGAFCLSGDRSGDRCLACHRPHGDDVHGLFRVAPVASHAGTDGACIACHRDAAPDSGGAISLMHPQESRALSGNGLPLASCADGGSHIGCVTCHDPHVAPSRSGALLRTTGAADSAGLCVSCHSDMRQIVMTAHSSESMRDNGFASAACRPCHQVHGDSRQIAQDLLWPSELRHADAAGGDAYCVSCHRDGGKAPAPATAFHPSVPMFDPAAAHGSPLPLFAHDGQRDANGTIGCRTCHLPHGRPTADVSSTVQLAAETRAQRLQLRPFEPPNVCTNCHSVDALRRFLYFHRPERRDDTVAAP